LIEQTLSEKKQRAGHLCDLVRPIFDPADCIPDAALVYDILDALQKAGKLRMETVQADGAFDGIPAPNTWFWIE